MPTSEHVVRRDDDIVLKRTVMLDVSGQRKRGKPKQTWRKQVEESVKRIGLEVEEAENRTSGKEGVRAIAEGMRCIRPPSTKTKTHRIKTG